MDQKNQNLGQEKKIDKSEQREKIRELNMDLLTKQTYADIIPKIKKKAEIVDIIEDSPPQNEILNEDEVEVFSPYINDTPPKITSFDTPVLPEFIKKSMKQLGYTTPTPIQQYSIPIALKTHDLISIAKTGSGKTFAFMIPCLAKIAETKMRAAQFQGMQRVMMLNNILGLVLAPTRELAIQIYNASKMMCMFGGLRLNVIYGGADRHSQMNKVTRGTDVLIATPGRLIDFLTSGCFGVSMVQYFVLDEADRMLDMGFFPQIRQICNFLPRSRQSMFFSATWPEEVEKLSYEICFNKPVKIKVGSEDLTLNSNITQNVEYVYDCDKRKRLLELFNQINDGHCKIIVFMRTKRSCDRLARCLEYEGYRAASIHGDKPQKQREYIINSFRNSSKNVLVATDVASRGLDIKDIKFVINYDFPQSIEDYVHRIGRTGRAGAKGTSYTFVNDNDVGAAADLVDLLEKSNQAVPGKLRDLSYCMAAKRKRKNKYGKISGGNNRFISRGGSNFGGRGRSGRGAMMGGMGGGMGGGVNQQKQMMMMMSSMMKMMQMQGGANGGNMMRNMMSQMQGMMGQGAGQRGQGFRQQVAPNYAGVTQQQQKVPQMQQAYGQQAGQQVQQQVVQTQQAPSFNNFQISSNGQPQTAQQPMPSNGQLQVVSIESTPESSEKQPQAKINVVELFDDSPLKTNLAETQLDAIQDSSTPDKQGPNVGEKMQLLGSNETAASAVGKFHVGAN